MPGPSFALALARASCDHRSLSQHGAPAFAGLGASGFRVLELGDGRISWLSLHLVSVASLSLAKCSNDLIPGCSKQHELVELAAHRVVFVSGLPAGVSIAQPYAACCRGTAMSADKLASCPCVGLREPSFGKLSSCKRMGVFKNQLPGALIRTPSSRALTTGTATKKQNRPPSYGNSHII